MPQKTKEWIGVDLDGTLAYYDGWISEDHIGDPIKSMVKKVQKEILDGKEIRIFTARVSGDKTGKIAKTISDWTEKHIGVRLPVTNVKDLACSEIWDDKARRVEKNTGEFAEGSEK